MNVPEKALFELGFGYKYQYLITVLIHCLIKDKVNLTYYQKKLTYIIKKNHNINSNHNIFFQEINTLLLLLKKLDYNKNCLLMIEGENSYFEDINLFTNLYTPKIYFMQVKGSMAQSWKANLHEAIISSIINMYKSKNSHLNFEFYIFINHILTSFYLLKNDNDKIKIIFIVLKKLKIINPSISTALFNKLEAIIEKYIEDLYNSNSNHTPLLITYVYQIDKRVFNRFKQEIKETSFNYKILKLKNIVDKIKIIQNLDYRMIYLFLKIHYGNDKLKKILWNIEMNAMNGKINNINDFKLKLQNINYSEDEIKKIKFAKDIRKFKIGKIL